MDLSSVSRWGESETSFPSAPQGKMKERAKRAAQAILSTLPPHARELVVLTVLLGYVPRIRNPVTFNEKIAHRKLCDYDPRFRVLADKWEVRAYVDRVVGPKYLNEVFVVGNTVNEVLQARLPDEFVVKPTHGSKAMLLVESRAELGEGSLERFVAEALSREFGAFQSEYWYREMPRRVMVERRIRDELHRYPRDYKFYVFDGRVHFIHVDVDRHTHHKRTIFDRRWIRQDVAYARPLGPEVPKPQALDEMIEVAEALGDGHEFVRVDLYSADDHSVLFGEMTFAPEGGRRRFRPRAFDYRLGELWVTAGGEAKG